jgi:peptidoglycan/xylan/chitin deacetylase (PgdA/CDA1 family)
MGSRLHFRGPASHRSLRAPPRATASPPCFEDDPIRPVATSTRRAALPIAAAFAAAFAALILTAGPSQTPHATGDVGLIRTGCVPGNEGSVTNAYGPERRVALTFDDGPSAFTPRVLRALRRTDARATFFVVGSQVEGRERLLRRMLRDGHEIGNHSMAHMPGPDESDIAQASETIEDATGFRPCQFRPPDGDVDDELVQRAAALGLSTVLWSVDAGDWQAQDPEAIRERVMSVIAPGSIVLLHDGGGDRHGTAEVAPQLIADLRDRGYELVTVTKLLGGRFTVGDPTP